MINRNKILSLLIFGCLSIPAVADGPGWTGSRDVVEVVTVINGGINVKLEPLLNDCVSQSGYGPRYAYISPDHPGLKLFQTNLLAAMMTGKKVALYLGDATCKATEMRLYK
ncbi:MAG: hypothetical protein K6L80_15540 [Agarilytica sp.]